MVRVIALDFVGVLVRELDNLNSIEEEIERFFGPNKTDEEFINQVKMKTNLTDIEIINNTRNIINKLYEIKDIDLINKIKDKYPSIKIIIATNHVSYVEDFIKNNFDVDNIIISSKINKIKPDIDFYIEVANIVNEKIEDILFLDDNINNIIGASKAGMQTIKIDRIDNVFNKINEYLGG